MTKGVSQSLLDAHKEAGSPDLDDSGEGNPTDAPEEDEIPLEAEGDDDSLPLEEEEDDKKPEAKSPESGTATSSEEDDEDQWPDDLPETYFGKDLKEYAQANGLEATKAYHQALQDATKDVNRRLEEIAEERKSLQQPSPERQQQQPGDAEPDVDAILRELGVNVNSPYAEEIRDDVLVPVARALAELRQGQETTASSAEADKFERDFFTGIDAAEKRFGEKLPLERSQILDLAVDQDIYSPEALYRYVMAPVWESERRQQRADVDEAKTKASEATKKAKQAASRAKGRRSSAPTSQSKPVKKGSIEDAARAAARSLGRSVVKLEK